MKIFILIIALCSSLVVQAARLNDLEVAGVFGMRSNQGSTNVSGASVDSRTGLQAGLLTWTPLRERFGLRTGILYTQRYVSLGPTAQGTVDIDFAYLDLPVTPTLIFSDYAQAFAGPVVSFNQSKNVSCSRSVNCVATDVKSFIVPLVMGLDFKILPNFGGEVYYEYVSGDLANNVSDMTAIGINALIYF